MPVTKSSTFSALIYRCMKIWCKTYTSLQHCWKEAVVSLLLINFFSCVFIDAFCTLLHRSIEILGKLRLREIRGTAEAEILPSDKLSKWFTIPKTCSNSKRFLSYLNTKSHKTWRFQELIVYFLSRSELRKHVVNTISSAYLTGEWASLFLAWQIWQILINKRWNKLTYFQEPMRG